MILDSLFVNHNGSVEMAKMGKCCERSGSGAMKLQTFKEEKVTNLLLIQIYINTNIYYK